MISLDDNPLALDNDFKLEAMPDQLKHMAGLATKPGLCAIDPLPNFINNKACTAKFLVEIP